MNLQIHKSGTISIAQLDTEGLAIHSLQDALDLLGNVYYQGMDKLILHAQQLSPQFFDLSTGLAGEILQKFSTYRIQLAIVGDFEGFGSASLQDFMRESNRQGLVRFVESREEALGFLSGGAA